MCVSDATFSQMLPQASFPKQDSPNIPKLDLNKPLKLADGTYINPRLSRPGVPTTNFTDPPDDENSQSSSCVKLEPPGVLDSPHRGGASSDQRPLDIADRERIAHEEYDRAFDERLDSLKRDFEQATGSKYRYESPQNVRNLTPLPELTFFTKTGLPKAKTPEKNIQADEHSRTQNSEDAVQPDSGRIGADRGPEHPEISNGRSQHSVPNVCEALKSSYDAQVWQLSRGYESQTGPAKRLLY